MVDISMNNLLNLYNSAIGLMSRVFASGLSDRGSN